MEYYNEVDYDALSDDEILAIQCQECVPVCDEYYECEGVDYEVFSKQAC